MGPERHWVVDVGVLLNLAADENPERLLRDLGQTLLAPRIGLTRPFRHPRTRRSVTELGQLGLSCIQIVEPSSEELDLMLEFAAAPNSVDDGEAAMLAVAECRGIGCLVDDPKITALVRRRPVPVPVLSTFGLLRAAVAEQRVTEARVAEALQSMIKFAGLVTHEDTEGLKAFAKGKPNGLQRKLF